MAQDPPAAPFVPLGFEPPRGLETETFRLRPLTPEVADLDLDALLSSAPRLRAMFGRGWPRDDFSLAENVADLVEHAEEFERREAFAYTVLSPDERECLGCVYLNPPRGHDPDTLAYDALVYLWVRESAYAAGFDRVLFEAVKAWLDAAWPFERAAFPGRREDGGWYGLEGRRV